MSLRDDFDTWLKNLGFLLLVAAVFGVLLFIAEKTGLPANEDVLIFYLIGAFAGAFAILHFFLD